MVSFKGYLEALMKYNFRVRKFAKNDEYLFQGIFIIFKNKNVFRFLFQIVLFKIIECFSNFIQIRFNCIECRILFCTFRVTTSRLLLNHGSTCMPHLFVKSFECTTVFKYTLTGCNLKVTQKFLFRNLTHVIIKVTMIILYQSRQAEQVNPTTRAGTESQVVMMVR